MSSEAMLKVLDEEAAKGGELANSIKATFSGALAVARAASRIREALTVELVREVILPLKNCDFGWRTDNGNYTDQQVRDMWVSAVLVGAVPVNNEVNMIAGRMYLAKNYFRRKVREFPGLTNLVLMPGKITQYPNGALVEYTATWALSGKSDTLARVGPAAIPVRLNSGMGADGALGKAERKILCAVFTQLTGSNFADGEAEDVIEDIPTAAAASVTVTESKPQLPDPKTQTQTRAVVEKVKKNKPEVKTETPASTAATVVVDKNPDSEPWNTNQSEPTTAATQAAPVAEQKTTVVAPATEANPGPATTIADPVGVTGEIECDHIGTIASVKAKDKAKNPPYTIMSQNGTKYLSDDIEVAKKANELLKANPQPNVYINYVKDGKGDYIICEIGEDIPAQATQGDQEGGDFA